MGSNDNVDLYKLMLKVGADPNIKDKVESAHFIVNIGSGERSLSSWQLYRKKK